MGVHIALGARRKRSPAADAAGRLRPAAVGLILGLAAAAVATRIIRELLYRVRPLDASGFAGVGIVVLVVAAARVLPAWRASQLDPIGTPRNE
jgi:putative ABC transport system permease protein